MRPSTTTVLATTAACVAIAGLALAFGPRRIALSAERTGDERIAAHLAANAEKGHHELAAFVYNDGEVAFGGLGADEHSQFEIGSITKTFNAELVRQLIEEGTLTLQTTVGSIIEVPGTAIADVAIEELINHTSGLKRMEGIRWYDMLLSDIRDGGNPNLHQSADSVLTAAATATLDERGKENYSNYGHALLGQLLSVRTGVSYPELLRTRIFDPAGMTGSFVATLEMRESLRRGLWKIGKPMEPWVMDGWAPAGAIRSTAHDIAKYAAWVAAHGRPDYGWGTTDAGNTGGEEFPFHNGGTFGFSSMLVWDSSNPSRAAFVIGDTWKPVDEIAVSLIQAHR